MPTATKPITAEEFAGMEFDVPVELVRGEVVYLYGEDGMTRPGPSHGGVCASITASLHHWASKSRAGRVASNDSWITTARNPDSVRGADVSYYRMEKLPGGNLPKGPNDIVPDLCVEVLSPSNAAAAQEKVNEYLNAGVEEVWVVDPEQRLVVVHRVDASPRSFDSQQTITSRVLPGYSAPVAEFFEGV